MALQFQDNKPYFAKPLALKTLFGERAFSDLKKLMDPCCGIGVDKICIAPCGSTPIEMCPVIQITEVTINCQTGDCHLTLVVTDANGPLTGRVQLQAPVILGIQVCLDLDNFSVPGNGTFIIPLPTVCQVISNGNVFDTLPLGIVNFFAYAPNGVSSNVFSSALIDFNCPNINDCGGDDKFCPAISCVDGVRTLTLQPTLTASGGTFTAPFFLQVAPEVAPPYTWTTVGPLSPSPVVGANTCTIDISSLPLGTYSYQIIDSSVPPITSYHEGIGIFGSDSAPTFTVRDPCGIITLQSANSYCVGPQGTLDATATWSNLTPGNIVQVEYESTPGVWSIIHVIGNVPSSGGPFTFTYDTSLVGVFNIRLHDTVSGVVSNVLSVTFIPCA